MPPKFPKFSLKSAKAPVDPVDKRLNVFDSDGSDADTGETYVEPEVVPQGPRRHFAHKERSLKSGPGTLEHETTSRFGMPSAPQPQPEKDIYARVVAKVSDLPPDIDEKTIEGFFASYQSLKVEKMEKIDDYRYKGLDRVAYKVTFSDDAKNGQDLLRAQKDLNDVKYLGRGYYLHLDRYLGGSMGQQFRKEPEPFDAHWVDAPETKFAPTAELGGVDRDRDNVSDRRGKKIITAYPPRDLETLKMIHWVIEGVLKGGQEFEAALMNNPKIQQDERHAFLYDSYHPLRRYYTFRLYQLTTGDKRPNVEIFPGYGEWQGWEPIPNECADSLETITNTTGMVDPPASEEEPRRQYADPYPGQVESDGWLTVKNRAFLVYLFTSLPLGDATNIEIAHITVFAFKYASDGMDEIINLVMKNIFHPLMFMPANPNYERVMHMATDAHWRQAHLNGLRVVSDICMSCSKAGGKSYKYREAIRKQLLERNVFEFLGDLPKRLKMGRLAKDQYQTVVKSFLTVWENVKLFDDNTLAHFRSFFTEQKKETDGRRGGKVPVSVSAPEKFAPKPTSTRETMETTGKRKLQMDSADEGDDTMAVDWENSKTDARDNTVKPKPTTPEPALAMSSQMPMSSQMNDEGTETAAARARRMRPKAEDMFASDGE